MPVQDRTNEFQACVESIRSRTSIPSRSLPEVKQRLLQTQDRGESSRSEFSRMAGGIGKEISATSIKLGKLAQCEYLPPLLTIGCVSLRVVAKRKTLFDDRPVEISVSPNFLLSLRVTQILDL